MAIERTKRKRRQSVAEPAAIAQDAEQIDTSLRPRSLQDYVGQSEIKGHLLVHIEAARRRKEPLGHAILHGPPGLGKTTLAHILAREMGAQMRVTSGPAIEKPGDLASLLTNLQPGDVLFIDEIHRMRPAIEEVLYSAMEDYVLDLMIGKGPSARSMRIDIQPFTLIGATTKIGAVSMPLRDRFIHNFRLKFYDIPEMQLIVDRASRLLSVPMDAESAHRIARASRATPRIANRLVRAVRDFAQVNDESAIGLPRVNHTLHALGIDDNGLDGNDRTILSTLIERFGGGPVGLSTLAAATAEEEETLEDVYEPYLMQCGYLQRTPKGRMATKHAYDLLGIPQPKNAATLF